MERFGLVLKVFNPIQIDIPNKQKVILKGA